MDKMQQASGNAEVLEMRLARVKRSGRAPMDRRMGHRVNWDLLQNLGRRAVLGLESY